MPRFGLKLGIGESVLARTAETLWRDKRYDFLELYIPLDASPADADNWRWYDGTLVLHAPHAVGGFNFAQREKEAENFRFLPRLDEIRRRLDPAIVVFHPGLNGSVDEAIRQIMRLRSAYPELHRCLALENKPRLGLNGEACLGASPEEMRELLGRAACGFCLDVRHACAYAAADGMDWRGAIRAFASLDPRLWHAADGDANDIRDSHHHIGEGTISWSFVAEFWRPETLVTIECSKRPQEDLRDFQEDLARLRQLCAAAPGHEFTLRAVTAADAEFLWRLANDPGVRAASFHPEPIPWETHTAWLESQLASPGTAFYLAEDESGRSVAQVRFHATGDGAWEIGVSVVAAARSRGLGSRIIARATGNLLQRPDCRAVHAWIKPDNNGSRAAFAKAGFRLAAAPESEGRILMTKEA